MKAIEDQDDAKTLFTLDPTNPDPIKLLSFEGRDDEDFSVFKKNRTCKAD